MTNQTAFTASDAEAYVRAWSMNEGAEFAVEGFGLPAFDVLAQHDGRPVCWTVWRELDGTTYGEF